MTIKVFFAEYEYPLIPAPCSTDTMDSSVCTNQQCRAQQWQSFPSRHLAQTTDLFKQLERLAPPASGGLQATG